MSIKEQLKAKFSILLPQLDERARRLVAAAEALSLPRGGISRVSEASGLSRVTLTAGIRELGSGAALPAGRMRRAGGGRKRSEVCAPGYAVQLEAIVDGGTRGDPRKPLRWTCKSTRAISRELSARGIEVSDRTVARSLREQGFSLQGVRKTEEGSANHPDRDGQFRHIGAAVADALRLGLPVISVDTKKKELVGNYANAGTQWRRKGAAPKVNGHDFPGPDVPRAFPYGVYDIGRNTGFVSVGTDHDTAEFAANSIRGWWRHEGRSLYPGAGRLTVTADGGGSNGYRLHLWKHALQRLADETGLEISVMHFPPGTSKWNKVEHRLFSFISSNWRGEPLRDYETIVSLIAKTTTAKGLRVTCRLDRGKYEVGRRVSDEEKDAIRITRDAFHGEWNYTICPRRG